MSFSSKIDEWIKEAETRPSSALMIVKLIAKRLRELTERNEELLAENLALQDGTRVEEYRKRIAHLEYQLELLKRRFGSEDAALAELPVDTAATSTLSVLVYNAPGRIFRIEIDSDQKETLGRIVGEMITGREPPRLLAVPSNEEVLLLFTTGRVGTQTVSAIPVVEVGGTWAWEQAALPDEPHAGELLACITPLSRLPLADFFLQTSRRGCVKKTMTSMAQSILANHYLGKSTLQRADQAFDVALCQKKERVALVTYEGHWLSLDIDDLSYAAEERIHLTANDFVVASFVTGPDESLLCVTQNGKVIQREANSLEPSKSPLAKGQALISPARLEQGVRFIGAASVRDADRIVVLDAAGNMTVHLVEDIVGAGSLHAGALILSIGVIPAEDRKSAMA
jgi:DNA gyrase/topoisomerase IV subunit A